MTKRRNFSDNFKASVALEALRGDKRVQVIEGMAVGFDPATLDLMHEIDRIFTKYPFFGSHQIAAYLPQSGFSAGRRCMRHLMGNGVTGHRKRAKQEQEAPQTRMFPCLLKNLPITRLNQVWCSDITYIPVENVFLYLVAIMDWATRHVLAWRLSNTMDASFCVEALNEALARHGRPEIFNTDQGSQFTSFDFTGVLKEAGITISMDGRGRCMDNIFIERLWRSLKYEAVYLHELTDGFKAERVIAEWIGFYNTERPHSALGGRTPAEAYGATRSVDMMDKAHTLPTSPQPQQHQLDMINKFLAA